MSLFTFIACSSNEADTNASANKPEELNTKDYIKYAASTESGCLRVQNIGDFEISVLFKTPEFIAVKEKGLEINNPQFNKELEDYSSTYNFNFRIKSKSGKDLIAQAAGNDPNEYLMVGDYLSFNIMNDFHLLSGKDTLNCEFSHFIRTYNIAPVLDFVLSFPKTENQKDLQLVYNDKLFGIGKVKFLFLKEDITTLPKLKS